MPLWLSELFCPEHGLGVLLPAILNYWGVWRMGMRFHIMRLRQAEARHEPSWS